jgi:hypothetical protein
MIDRLKRRLQALAALAIFVIIVSFAIAFLTFDGTSNSKANLTSTGYLTYRGAASKIYIVSIVRQDTTASETLNAPDGQVIPEGSPLVVLDMTVRNDYSADDPPPAVSVPVAPVDGTAYLYLAANLLQNGQTINSTCISIGDFVMPNKVGTSMVIASGQTVHITINLSPQATPDQYNVTLAFLGDSIPT